MVPGEKSPTLFSSSSNKFNFKHTVVIADSKLDLGILLKIPHKSSVSFAVSSDKYVS